MLAGHNDIILDVRVPLSNQKYSVQPAVLDALNTKCRGLNLAEDESAAAMEVPGAAANSSSDFVKKLYKYCTTDPHF